MNSKQHELWGRLKRSEKGPPFGLEPKEDLLGRFVVRLFCPCATLSIIECFSGRRRGGGTFTSFVLNLQALSVNHRTEPCLP